jgi:hypothetical protein
MKNLSLIILLIIAALLFTIGLFIPGTGKPLHIIFVVSGMVLGFLFYLLSFIQVIKTPSLSNARRIFWIVLIVCVPMIGNLIYIVVHDTLTRRQVPKQQF